MTEGDLALVQPALHEEDHTATHQHPHTHPALAARVRTLMPHTVVRHTDLESPSTAEVAGEALAVAEEEVSAVEIAEADDAVAEAETWASTSTMPASSTRLSSPKR